LLRQRGQGKLRHRSRSNQTTMRSNMKKNLISLLACAFLLVLAGCGKSEETTTQPEADAVFFERTCARVSGLIASKDYPQARSTLDTFKNYKLTEEQKKIVDQLDAKIPKTQ
jgi:hypothetical protein